MHWFIKAVSYNIYWNYVAKILPNKISLNINTMATYYYTVKNHIMENVNNRKAC